MKTRNSCYTYFKIVGNFNPDEVSELLNIKCEKSWKIGDKRSNDTQFDFSFWSVGRCDEYDVETANQMRKTIAVLLDKIDILNKIREENDVSFYLEIVPTIYLEDTNPVLAPTLDIIDFCHETRTEIDIDMYVLSADDE